MGPYFRGAANPSYVGIDMSIFWKSLADVGTSATQIGSIDASIPHGI